MDSDYHPYTEQGKKERRAMIVIPTEADILLPLDDLVFKTLLTHTHVTDTRIG